MVVFTARKAPSPYYQSFVAGGIKLDLRRLRPADVISISVSAEKQEQQNIRKLKSMNQDDWTKLVDLVDVQGNAASLDAIKKLLKLEASQEAEALAARANVTAIVKSLHDKSSNMLKMLTTALAAGKLCVVDVSKMSGGQALIFCGLILKNLFDHNQEEFTKADSKTIPTIAVLEEAQSVLHGNDASIEPFITWVKEGRKYDLGAMMITQQPGSIPTEILSQGDNWFVFHLLSAVDLNSVKNANAHYSNDLLSSLLNEPIPGQGVFWSSVGDRAYPLPIRVLSFEHRVGDPVDKNYNQPLIQTYAKGLRDSFIFNTDDHQVSNQDVEMGQETEIDLMQVYIQKAKAGLSKHQRFRKGVDGSGYPWGGVKAIILESLPENVADDQLAYDLVVPVLNAIFGSQDNGWHSFKSSTGRTYVKVGAKE